jgi:hypothetical protein
MGLSVHFDERGNIGINIPGYTHTTRNSKRRRRAPGTLIRRAASLYLIVLFTRKRAVPGTCGHLCHYIHLRASNTNQYYRAVAIPSASSAPAVAAPLPRLRRRVKHRLLHHFLRNVVVPKISSRAGNLLSYLKSQD